MTKDIKKFFATNGGVASVNEVAVLLDSDESAVRQWARENEVKRVGSTFVFTVEAALDCAQDLEEDEEDEEDEDNPLEDDDDEDAA